MAEIALVSSLLTFTVVRSSNLFQRRFVIALGVETAWEHLV